MIAGDIAALLAQVAGGQLSPQAALERLRHFPVESLDYARVDHLRPLVQGHAEVVFCQGKTPAQCVGICESLAGATGSFMATRADAATAAALQRRFPAAVYAETARAVYLAPTPRPVTGRGTVLVLTAGTGDIPVAEEAAVASEFFGNPTERLYDVGVAGIHRLLQQQPRLARHS